MFEDILDGFKDLEDELEKEQPGMTTPDPENILSLDSDSDNWTTGDERDGNWDTGKSWEAEERIGQDDKIWGV